MVAIVIMIALGVFGAYLIVRRKGFVSNLIDILLMFPYVIPGAVLGICLLTTFSTGVIILSGTMWIIIISYVIRKLPYTMRSSVGILYQIDVSLEEASLNLGVSKLKTFFKITFPLMVKGVISGAILSFIGVLNTLSATLVLYTGKTITLPVSIFACINNDSFGRASAMATVLTFTTIICLLLFNKLTKGKGSVI